MLRWLPAQSARPKEAANAPFDAVRAELPAGSPRGGLGTPLAATAVGVRLEEAVNAPFDAVREGLAGGRERGASDLLGPLQDMFETAAGPGEGLELVEVQLVLTRSFGPAPELA